ncbi:hypothetical protein [Thalassovita aquimarina]|uniref:hypothetical protein n=1 Tax=Thalassovita aquimarina TaxID=2785917 RepID=UPI003569B968
MWKPIAVLAAAGSVSVHLIVLSSYSSPEENSSSVSLLSNPDQIVQMEGSDKKTILIGHQANAGDGPAVKMARDTFFRFPEGTRIVSKTATESLMIVDLAIPMGRTELVDEFRAAVNSAAYSFKLPKGQGGSVKIEFWSDEGSGQIVLDEISDKKTSASIRIYGQGLFSRT